MLLSYVIGFLLTITTDSIIQANGMRQSSTNVCMTDLCQQIARETISSMDETFDPCVDFYAYACNRWNSSNGLANEVIAPMIREQLQELFDSGNYTNPTEKKAIDVYDQCISQKRGHSSGGGSLVRVLDDVMGGWSLLKDHYNVSSFRLDDTLVRLQQNDIRTFSDLTVNRNEFSSEENILFFTPPSRLFGRWRLGSLINAHYKPTVRNATAQLMKIWSPVVLRLLIEANTNVHRPTVEKRLEKALMLDVTLAKGSTELVLHRKRLTFGDLKRPPFRSRFLANFLSLFNTMLKASSVEFHATPATQFGVQPQLEYLINLDHTMAQLECEGDAGLATLVDWLWWTALYHLVYRETGTCVELVKAAMPLTVSGMFFKTYIPRGAVQEAKLLTAEIANSVRDAVLLNTDWMDRDSQEFAMTRLNHTLRNVGYPEEFLGDWRLIDDLYAKVQVGVKFYDTLRTIDQSNSWINLQKLSRTNARNDPYFPPDLTSVNAKVYPDSNYIVIPAALLQPPMFYANSCEIVNYARLGAVLGHEFTHVFDFEDGIFFNWWTNATRNKYNAKKYTLVDFYNSISTKNDSIDGRQTLSENTADNGGYRAAYLAYHNFLHRTGYRIKLPGLEAFTEDQLFWLIGAQTWCIRKEAPFDAVHAPFRYRVMGPYMNSANFSAAYNCPLGSPMNPRIKAW